MLNPEKNIFKSGAEVLVNPVNCQGVVEKGLPLRFREAYPEMVEECSKACKKGLLKIGGCMVLPVKDGYVANVAIRKYGKHPSQVEWVVNGVRNLRKEVEKTGAKSVAIPQIGCGLGGLEWSVMRPLVVKELDGAPFDVWLSGEVFLRDKDGIVHIG